MAEWGATLRQINTVAAAARNTSYQENNWKGRVQKSWSEVTTFASSLVLKACEWAGLGGGGQSHATSHHRDEQPGHGSRRRSASRSSSGFPLPSIRRSQVNVLPWHEPARSHHINLNEIPQGPPSQREHHTRGRQGHPCMGGGPGMPNDTRHGSKYGRFSRSRSPGRRPCDLRQRSPRRDNHVR